MRRMHIITRTLTAAALLAATSCSSTVRSGDSSMFLVVASLAGIRGGPTLGLPSGLLISDVRTLVTTGATASGQCTQASPCPVVFGDNGQATLSLARKDVFSATAPTTNNQVTLTRIHVHYRLPDGSSNPGVTVPFDFDTFATAVVPATGTVQISFELVRVQAKESAPLFQLNKFPIGSGGQIAAVADVTFFGKDQVGNDISATGSISIEFGDWVDASS
jgi:hypothetical protein